MFIFDALSEQFPINVHRLPDDAFLTGPKTKEHWDPDFQNLVSPLSTPASNLSYKRKKCIIDDPADYIDMSIPIAWSLNDLVMASRLLVGGGSERQCNFSDEYETRRVYSMVYDVFRCKYSSHFYHTEYFECVDFNHISDFEYCVEFCTKN